MVTLGPEGGDDPPRAGGEAGWSLRRRRPLTPAARATLSQPWPFRWRGKPLYEAALFASAAGGVGLYRGRGPARPAREGAGGGGCLRGPSGGPPGKFQGRCEAVKRGGLLHPDLNNTCPCWAIRTGFAWLMRGCRYRKRSRGSTSPSSPANLRSGCARGRSGGRLVVERAFCAAEASMKLGLLKQNLGPELCAGRGHPRGVEVDAANRPVRGAHRGMHALRRRDTPVGVFF